MKFVTCFIVFISLGATGCSQKVKIGPVGNVLSFGDEQSRVWPDAPSAPRIRYVQSIGSAADLGFEAPAMERIFDFVVGKADLRLTRPYGIAVEGRLLAIADPGAAVIHLMDLKGEFYKRISKIGTTDLLSPIGIAIGGDRLFVSDSALNKVFVLNLDGELIRELDGLMRPTGLAFDVIAQRLYIAETLGHRIAVFDPEGARLFNVAFGDEVNHAFNAPTHIAYRDGVLLINDTMNFRVVAMDGDGLHLRSFGTHGTGSGHFAQSKGVDMDSHGNIYVADAIFNRVQIFDQYGKFLLAFGNSGHDAGDLWMPAGVFVAGDMIFVADSHNKRVQVFEYVGGWVE